MTDRNRNIKLFPEGLLSWSGHSSGAVRQLFQSESGRPTGSQIETPLVKRINEWVGDLIQDKNVPRILFLVGGPGNGKSDAIEGCISSFDSQLGAGGELFDAFAKQYYVDDSILPPRKTVVDLTSLKTKVPNHLLTSIFLVQDATEPDASAQVSAEESLINDLELLLKEDFSGLYLCCVNRGILAVATETSQNSRVTDLLIGITKAVTSAPNPPDCWPLKDFEKIAIWPMDMESLVDRNRSDNGQSVGHMIFNSALEVDKWKEPCELKTRCPFCQNRKLLTTSGALDSLIDILHYYELVSGKRWGFRDIFSLVPFLLVGDSADLHIKGKSYSPCEWAAEQYRISLEGKEGSVERDRAPYFLMSRLYHHRLFPRWPAFKRGDILKARRDLLNSNFDGSIYAKALFRFVESSNTALMNDNLDVSIRIRDSIGPALDPALVTGKELLYQSGETNLTVDDIEINFSLSVKTGVEAISTQLQTLEKDVLAHLIVADESLSEDDFARNRARQVRLIQSTIRQFSARLCKRSLGTRRGVCYNIVQLRSYLALRGNAAQLNEIRKNLKKLLHDEKGRFRAGLATTFGQPVAHESKDVALLTQRPVRISESPMSNTDQRPIDYLPYLTIEKHYIALTFDLFRALKDVSNGLHEASLPTDIYALLDRVKSLVSGQLVRDPDVLSDDPVIAFGASTSGIEYVNGRFIFSKDADL